MATPTLPDTLERADQARLTFGAKAGAGAGLTAGLTADRGAGVGAGVGDRSAQATRRAVVVHSGARDAYQVALALDERGLLDSLVTDLYWPGDRRWATRLLALLPAALRGQLRQRSAAGLDSAHVRSLTTRGLATLLLDKLPQAPFAWRRSLMRQTDAALGAAAGRRARRSGKTLLSYSYYAYHAFAEANAPAMLFQLHPHPASMRRILAAELAAHPECAESLGKEWELALPDEDFARLVAEPKMAAHTLVASSFTRDTLIEHGTPLEAITVIPYGVDCTRFSPAPADSVAPPRSFDGPLRLLFVGRINQRKGILYLLEALRLLHRQDVHLTVCGRVVDSLEVFKPFAGQVTIRPDVGSAELVEAYREADLFVFPSVGEGFGQVLLEALACGLPVLSTTATAAPDLIDEGVEGWVVAPGRADLLVRRIEWACEHRAELAGMRAPARARAERFTWARFRAGVAASFEAFVAEHQAGQPAEQQAGQPAGQRAGQQAEHQAGQQAEKQAEVGAGRQEVRLV